MEEGNVTTIEEPLVKRRFRFNLDCFFFTAQFAIRFIIIFFTFTAICLIATSHHALSLIAFRLLLCADAIACCYTMLSFTWFWPPYTKESNSNSYTGPFYCDLLASLLLSFACIAAAAAGDIAQLEQHVTGRFSLCSGGVCTKTTVALDISRLAFLSFFNLSLLVIVKLG